MGTLSSCLKKIGLAKHEAAILRGATDDNIKDGDEAHIAAVRAVSDYIEQLEKERNGIAKQVIKAGGKPTAAPFKLADLAALTKVLRKGEAEAYNQDKQPEKENVTDQRSGTDLERNRQDAEAADGLGTQGVRDGRAGDGRTGKSGVSEGQEGSRSVGGSELLRPEAPAAGERGNLEIYTGSTRVSPGSAGSRVDSGSGDVGLEGAPIEPDATEAIERTATGRTELTDKAAAQSAANKKPDTGRGLDSVTAALPILHPGQREDVVKAEARFDKDDGYGMLFTNGTGTGKTFTGLGVVRRFVNEGKSDIIIVAPNDKIIEDWQNSGKLLGLDIKRLDNTTDAGSGIVITTYANFGANETLADRDWNLVVADETHYMLQSKDANVTNAVSTLRAITLHPDGAHRRTNMIHRELVAKLADADHAAKMARNSDDERDWYQADDLEKKANALRRELEQKRDDVKADIAARQGKARTRGLFLSATPFAYEKTVDWANGYLFDYNEGRGDEREGRAYNEGSNREQFFMQHFGYRMRYNKLTEPDARVDRGLMQRQFNSWLKKAGSLSGRMLDVEADYDRRFILTESAVGARIDEALDWFDKTAKEFAEANPESTGLGAAVAGKTDPYYLALGTIRRYLYEKFDYLSRRYLLEAIKAKEVIPHIKEHLAMGRKVVVFHDYKKGGGFNPFNIHEHEISAEAGDDLRKALQAQNRVISEFRYAFADLMEHEVFDSSSPIIAFQEAFPNVLLFNGDVPSKQRRANVAKFNDDATGPQVILVQSAAGKEGISLHDTTGVHQRVLFNLGQPTQPTTAIQQEGRIYRTGQVTDALFRYLTTGTNWEKWAFATTIAQRASAAENLGMGEQARMLKDAFIEAYEEADDYRAGMEGEGKGGKERDRAANEALTDYDRAKGFYFGTQKKTSKTKAAEGADYFATPEPVGYKMVEFAGIRGGNKVLEPSAGHGAIARWFPENAERTAVEPSGKLRPRLAMVFDGKIVDSDFEGHNVVNKYDAIVMNPPFGTGGKLAVEHLAKAATHLNDGGRIVALLPSGPMADKRLDKFLYEEAERDIKPLYEHPELGAIYRGDTVTTKAGWAPEGKLVRRDAAGYLWIKQEGKAETYVAPENWTAVKKTGPRTETYKPAEHLQMIADIKLPGVTFERAGTGVMTHIIVLEKQTDAAKASDTRGVYDRDLTRIDDIGELFDQLEDMALPGRPMTEAEQAAEQAEAEPVKPTRETRFEKKDKPAVDMAAASEQAQAEGLEIIEYTTKKGKKLKGAIRTDLTKEQAQAIDKFTWKKDGGYFIRAEHMNSQAYKDSLGGSAQYSRPAKTGDMLFQADNPITKPTHEQEKSLDALLKALEKDAAAAQVSANGIRGITLQQVPDAYRGFVQSIERLFGISVQFVRAQGLDPALQFQGVYLGGKTLYVNVNAKSPYSTIIGHEFLHYLAKNKPTLFKAFEAIALPLMETRANQYAAARMKEYKKAGASQMKALALGQEEVFADTFGDLWADESFWKELAGRKGAKGIVARVMDQLRSFIGRIVGSLNLWGSSNESAGFYSDDKAIRKAVLDTTQKAMAERGKWLADAGDRLAKYMKPQGGANTIEVDGVERPRTNSEGSPIHATDDGIRNFWRWFGDSKVVDDQGRPLVVYHGTTKAGFTEFSTGRNSKVDGAYFFTSNKRMARSYSGLNDEVVFKEEDGEVFSDQSRGIYSSYLKIDKPHEFDFGGANWDGTLKDPIYNLTDENGDILDSVYTLEDAERHVDDGIASGYEEETQMYTTTDAEVREAMRLGNDGAILYDVEDNGDEYDAYEAGNVYVAFSPEQIKSATGNNGDFDPDNSDIRFSRRSVSETLAGAFQKSSPQFANAIRDAFDGDTSKTFNWYHKTIGSQFHKAKIDSHFRKVFERTQQFIEDVSRYGSEWADMAPDLLPKMDSFSGSLRALRYAKRDNEDQKAISKPIFEGTLHEQDGQIVGRVWSDAELKDQFGLNQRQIGLYHQFRSAVDGSLDDLAIAEMNKVARANEMEMPGYPMKMRDLANFYRSQYATRLDDLRAEYEKSESDYQNERRLLLDASANLNVSGKRQKEKLDNLDTNYAGKQRNLQQQIEELETLDKAFSEKADTIDKLKKQGYAPLMRFGRYTLDIVEQQPALDDNGNQIVDPDTGEIQMEDQHVFFAMFDTEAQAKEAERVMADEYPKATITRGVASENEYQLFGAVNPGSLEMLAELAGKEDEIIQRFYKQAVAGRSALKRLIHRKGTAGYSDDVSRSLASFLMSNARAAASADHFGDIMQAAADIPKQKGDVKDEAIKLINYVRNPNEEAGTLRGLLFMQYLGGSLASAAVNLTQTMTTTMPYLHQFGATPKDLIGAGRDALARMRGKDSSLSHDLRVAIQQAEDEGVLEPHNIHALMGQAGIQGLQHHRSVRLMTQVWGSFFGMAEQFNRETAFIASFNRALAMGPDGLRGAYEKQAQLNASRGLPPPSRAAFANPFAFAKNAVDETQFVLSKAARPNWARGAVGSTLFTFKQFSVFYLELLKRLPNRERALMLATLVALSGVGGLPGSDDLDDILDTLGQAAGYNTNLKKWKDSVLTDAFGKTGADFVLSGVSAFLPLELSARLGMGNLLPMSGALKKSNSGHHEKEIMELLGPAGGYFKQLTDAWDYTLQGRYGMAVAQGFAPKAIKDIVKGFDMLESGVYSDTKGRRITDVTPLEALIKAIGFQPSSVADIQRIKGQEMQDIGLNKIVSRSISEIWAEGVHDHNADRVKTARAMLKEWNDKNPESPISIKLSNVQRRANEMALTAQDRMEKAAPKAMRENVRKAFDQ